MLNDFQSLLNKQTFRASIKQHFSQAPNRYFASPLTTVAAYHALFTFCKVSSTFV
jgi:hypothetical protein